MDEKVTLPALEVVTVSVINTQPGLPGTGSALATPMSVWPTPRAAVAAIALEPCPISTPWLVGEFSEQVPLVVIAPPVRPPLQVTEVTVPLPPVAQSAPAPETLPLESARRQFAATPVTLVFSVLVASSVVNLPAAGVVLPMAEGVAKLPVAMVPKLVPPVLVQVSAAPEFVQSPESVPRVAVALPLPSSVATRPVVKFRL